MILEITELQRRALRRALMVTLHEDKKSDGKEAKKAIDMGETLLKMINDLKTE